MDTLAVIHSHMRWIVLLVAVAALVKTAVTFFGKKSPTKLDITLVRTFGILIALQFVTGLITLFAKWQEFGDGRRFRIEHATMMVVSMILVHLTARWRKAPAPIAARNTFLMVLGSIILIILAILVLPQGAEKLGLK